MPELADALHHVAVGDVRVLDLDLGTHFLREELKLFKGIWMLAVLDFSILGFTIDVGWLFWCRCLRGRLHALLAFAFALDARWGCGVSWL